MAGFATRRRPRPRPRRGRVIALFGPPRSGRTLLSQVLIGASKEMCKVQQWPTDNLTDLVALVDVLAIAGEVVFVDSVATAGEVRALYEAGHIDITGGAVVQVQADVPLTDDERHTFNQLRASVEDVVRMYSLPYFTVNNVHGDAEAAIGELARRAQLRR